MQYIGPGLIMMSVVTTVTATWCRRSSARSSAGTSKNCCVAAANWLIVPGLRRGRMLRGLLVGLIVTIIALFFTHLHVEHLFVVIAAVLLTSVVFSLGGFVTRCSRRTSTRSRSCRRSS